MIFNKQILFIFILITTISLAQETVEIEKKYSKAVTQLLKNKKIKAAFTTIEKLESKTMARHITLTEIEAPPFKEAKRAAVFADYFKKYRHIRSKKNNPIKSLNCWNGWFRMSSG